jgi:hypothetical protein
VKVVREEAGKGTDGPTVVMEAPAGTYEFVVKQR